MFDKSLFTMKKKSLLLIFITALCVNAFGAGKNIHVADNIELIGLADGFYMHQTIDNIPGFGKVSSNGLLAIKNQKAFMIDSPSSPETTAKLFGYLKDSMNVDLILFTGGHFHVDCIGGMGYLKSAGVKTFLNQRTKAKCNELNLPLPDTTYDRSYFFNFEGIPVECRYLGGGHTADNCVVYFPNQQILFGGCLIKSAASTSPGNLQDAVVGEWKSTVQQIIDLYPSVKIVIPGHGDLGGADLLNHTIALVDQCQKKE